MTIMSFARTASPDKKVEHSVSGIQSYDEDRGRTSCPIAVGRARDIARGDGDVLPALNGVGDEAAGDRTAGARFQQDLPRCAVESQEIACHVSREDEVACGGGDARHNRRLSVILPLDPPTVRVDGRQPATRRRAPYGCVGAPVQEDAPAFVEMRLPGDL